jgi:hypothetical protein
MVVQTHLSPAILQITNYLANFDIGSSTQRTSLARSTANTRASQSRSLANTSLIAHATLQMFKTKYYGLD